MRSLSISFLPTPPHLGLVERLSVTYVSNEGWALSYRFEWVKLIWCQVQQNHKNLNCWVTRHQKAKSWLLWRLKWRMTRTVEFKFEFYLIPMLSVVWLWYLCVKAVVVDSDSFLFCSPDANDQCPFALRNVGIVLLYLRSNSIRVFCWNNRICFVSDCLSFRLVWSSSLNHEFLL